MLWLTVLLSQHIMLLLLLLLLLLSVEQSAVSGRPHHVRWRGWRRWAGLSTTQRRYTPDLLLLL